MRYLFFAIALFVATFCTVFFGIKAVRSAFQEPAKETRAYEDYCDGDMPWCAILHRSELERSAQ
jgi:hypothetical protein